ncbi:MAG: hypothetical protein M1839_009496 [Geoglossum umbratile]|nr:MAG: hypothetical protein M1839_009496 [Geoglossum umbratile]
MDLHSHFPHRKRQNPSHIHTATQTQNPDSKKHHVHHTKPSADKKVAQSAVSLHPPPSALLGPSAGTSSAGSQSRSRRGSFAVGEDERLDITSGQRVADAEEMTSESRKARANAVLSRELRASIAALTKLSSITSRRLDDTYYLLLEKVAALSSAIAQLRDVASLTARLHQDFQSEAEAIKGDLGSRIDVFKGGFESEQKTIEGLEVRVKSQRLKAAKLRERLQEVRRRVKGWERTEGEWQAKTTRRFRFLLGALLSITVLLLILRYWPGHSVNSKPSLNRHNILQIASDNAGTGPTSLYLPQPSEKSMSGPAGRTVQEHPVGALLSYDQQVQHQSDDSCPDAVERTLRLFDEL